MKALLLDDGFKERLGKAVCASIPSVLNGKNLTIPIRQETEGLLERKDEVYKHVWNNLANVRISDGTFLYGDIQLGDGVQGAKSSDRCRLFLYHYSVLIILSIVLLLVAVLVLPVLFGSGQRVDGISSEKDNSDFQSQIHTTRWNVIATPSVPPSAEVTKSDIKTQDATKSTAPSKLFRNPEVLASIPDYDGTTDRLPRKPETEPSPEVINWNGEDGTQGLHCKLPQDIQKELGLLGDEENVLEGSELYKKTGTNTGSSSFTKYVSPNCSFFSAIIVDLSNTATQSVLKDVSAQTVVMDIYLDNIPKDLVVVTLPKLNLLRAALSSTLCYTFFSKFKFENAEKIILEVDIRNLTNDVFVGLYFGNVRYVKLSFSSLGKPLEDRHVFHVITNYVTGLVNVTPKLEKLELEVHIPMSKSRVENLKASLSRRVANLNSNVSVSYDPYLGLG